MDPTLEPDWLHLQYPQIPNNTHFKQVPPRACQECRRKKTKCDMQQPACSLCVRIDINCSYPTTRKVNRHRARKASRETAALQGNNHPDHPDPQLIEPDLCFDMSPLIVPHEPDETSMDSLLETLLDYQQPQFTPADLDGFGFTGQHSRSVVNLDQPDSAIFEPSNFTVTTAITPRSPIDNQEGCNQAQSSEAVDNISMLECSANLAEHLFELFFSRVQNFLPLLHRHKLYAEIFDLHSNPEKKLRIADIPTALLLNSMFALSARFSKREDVWTGGPKERGTLFYRKVKALLSHHEEQDEPSLRMLQIRILLAYYELTSGPSFQAWQATGVCCRMAYSLSLHQLDRKGTRVHNPAALTDAEWVTQEEKRRAWWAVFQMDNFASIVACRPFNIDTSRMDVLLPICDAAWTNNQRTKSVLLSPNGPSEMWKCLQGCENQDIYAWYLVCNGLLRTAHHLFDKPDGAIEDLKILQSALHCFALSLPPNFSSSGSNMMFDENNYPEKNWVVCTTLLLQAAHTYTNLALEVKTSAQRQDSQQHGTVNASYTRLSYHRFIDVCGPFVNDHQRAVRSWSPDFVPFASPLIACSLIGPASVFAIKQFPDSTLTGSSTLHSLEATISLFLLRRLSKYWLLGTSMERVLENLELPIIMETSSNEKIPITWIEGLMPHVMLDS